MEILNGIAFNPQPTARDSNKPARMLRKKSQTFSCSRLVNKVCRQ